VDQLPCRASHLRLAAPRLPWRRADFPAIPAPFDERPLSLPHMRRVVTPTTVPLSGLQPLPDRSPTDAATSQRFPGKLRLVAMFHATPPLGFGSHPPECSPRSKRPPLSGPRASLRFSNCVRPAMLVSLSPAVSPTPALLHDCLVPRLTKGSLSHRAASHPTFPVTLGHAHRDQFDHSLCPLRSFLPLASPFARALGFPRPHGRYSPGLSAPLRPSPLAPWVLIPA